MNYQDLYYNYSIFNISFTIVITNFKNPETGSQLGIFKMWTMNAMNFFVSVP
jgi:hypothetical protein